MPGTSHASETGDANGAPQASSPAHLKDAKTSPVTSKPRPRRMSTRHFASEAEREAFERDEAVAAISPPAEYRGQPLEEQEIEEERKDEFLVIWDEDDLLNPKVSRFAHPRFSATRFLTQNFIRIGPKHTAGICAYIDV